MSYKNNFFKSSVLKEITVEIPLEIDNNNSGFKTIKEDEIEKAINFDIKSILMTLPGERFDSQFGVGIQTYLFEQLTSNTEVVLKKTISDQISTYLPWLSQFNVKVVGNQTKQSIFVTVSYRINNPEIVGTFNLSLDSSEL